MSLLGQGMYRSSCRVPKNYPHSFVLLNTFKSLNLCIGIKRRAGKKIVEGIDSFHIRLSTVAWKQLGSCFEMLYVVQALVQSHVTPHMVARGKQRMLSALFSSGHK